jgi:uncharacterized membrane protein
MSSMPSFLKSYLAALVVIGLLDALWLGAIATDFYREQLGAQMLEQVRWAPAALFYFAYPAGLVALALYPAGQPMAWQVLRAAGVGLLAYGVYDLTNRATLQRWPVALAVVDMAWGTLISAAAGAAAAWVARRPG